LLARTEIELTRGKDGYFFYFHDALRNPKVGYAGDANDGPVALRKKRHYIAPLYIVRLAYFPPA
jgi:hypothetical protein